MTNEWVWSIGGFDPSGCAGILADKSIFDLKKVKSCQIPTLLTAQNIAGVEEVYPICPSIIEQQIETLKKTCMPRAIKIGAIANKEVIDVVIKSIATLDAAIIYDPVLSSSSGFTFTNSDSYGHILAKLLPRCNLITPNIPEAQLLLDREISSSQCMITAAKDLINLGCKSVYLKGGHNPAHQIHDLYYEDTHPFFLSSPNLFYRDTHPLYAAPSFSKVSSYQDTHSSSSIETNIRGTGCRLSALFVSNWFLEQSLKDTLIQSKIEFQSLLSNIESANSSTAIFKPINLSLKTEHLPRLSSEPSVNKTKAFIDCGSYSLGIYPIVDSVQWVKKAIDKGVTTIQLRIKSGSIDYIKFQIKQSVILTKRAKVRLFINDYWQLAIKYQAYGVHLGQTDINDADLEQIRQAGLRLGISTHSHYEMLRAYSLKPSYLAFGPIFPTTSKIMPFHPQGIEKLQYWLSLIDIPIVAIGGINESNINQVKKATPDGIAMISAFYQDTHPTISKLIGDYLST